MTEIKYSTPILFIVFNRPEATERVFQRLKKLEPPILYIAADGPRPNNTSDSFNCNRVREIVSNISWPCQVFKLFRNNNLGCKIAVSEAINWFFQHVDEGIILEDDCLPSDSFFMYCQILLEKYRNDRRVVHINGNNFNTQSMSNTTFSYHFVYYPQVWGWATWKRAWDKYDVNLTYLPDFCYYKYFRHLDINESEFKYLKTKWWNVYNGNVDTWDYQWHFINMLENNLVIGPTKNLISNLGFNMKATHTTGKDSLKGNLPIYEISFPLNHPPCLFVDSILNRSYKNYMVHENIYMKLMRKIKNYSTFSS